MGQGHTSLFALAACGWMAASMMVASGRAEAPPIGGAATMPAKAARPQRGEPGWDYAFEELTECGLPTDIPLPERTPYDGDAAQRDDYMRGYRAGFADGIAGSITNSLNVSRIWYEGKSAGTDAGRSLWSKRGYAEIERRYGFTTGKDIGEKSPPADRAIRDSFMQFRARLLTSVKEQFPRGLKMSNSDKDWWSVVTYTYDDYSESNSGTPVRRQAVKATCSFTLSVVPDAAEDAEMDELRGEYVLIFDPKDGRWVWDDQNDFHTQREGRDQEATGFITTYRGGGRKLVVDRIGKAIEEAGRPAIEASAGPPKRTESK